MSCSTGSFVDGGLCPAGDIALLAVLRRRLTDERALAIFPVKPGDRVAWA